MKRISTAFAVALGAAALAACNQSAQEQAAENIEANADMTIENVEANAENMIENIEATTENVTSNIEANAENAADAVADGNTTNAQ